MVFKKNGVAPISEILCACGGSINKGKCSKCGKDFQEKIEDNKKEASRKKNKK